MKRALIVGAVVALGLTGCTGSREEQVCSPPQPVTTPTHVHPGDKVRFVVVYYATCRDNNLGSTITPSQWKDVHVVFEQAGVERGVAIADADPTGRLEVDVVVPADAQPGEAHLRADSTLDAVIRVE